MRSRFVLVLSCLALPFLVFVLVCVLVCVLVLVFVFAVVFVFVFVFCVGRLPVAKVKAPHVDVVSEDIVSVFILGTDRRGVRVRVLVRIISFAVAERYC